MLIKITRGHRSSALRFFVLHTGVSRMITVFILPSDLSHYLHHNLEGATENPTLRVWPQKPPCGPPQKWACGGFREEGGGFSVQFSFFFLSSVAGGCRCWFVFVTDEIRTNFSLVVRRVVLAKVQLVQISSVMNTNQRSDLIRYEHESTFESHPLWTRINKIGILWGPRLRMSIGRRFESRSGHPSSECQWFALAPPFHSSRQSIITFSH